MTRRSFFLSLFAITLVTASCAIAQSPIVPDVTATTSLLPEPLRKALAQLVTESPRSWAYTRETIDDIGHYVERFDPALPYAEQWQLVSFEGQLPGRKDLRYYRRHYDELFERDLPTEIDLESGIDSATVMLIDETDDVLVYSFRPLPKDSEDAKLALYLSGRMTVNKQGGYVESMHITNTQEFSPARLVTITSFSLRLDLAPISDQGPVFVIALEGAVMGRLMRIKKLAEQERTSFRDFEIREVADEL